MHTDATTQNCRISELESTLKLNLVESFQAVLFRTTGFYKGTRGVAGVGVGGWVLKWVTLHSYFSQNHSTLIWFIC